MRKNRVRRVPRDEAQQVFRQLAWHIAGTLALGKSATGRGRRTTHNRQAAK